MPTQARDGQPPPIAPLDPAKQARSLPSPGSVDDLVASADAGNAIAACQLAAELTDCRTRQFMRNLDPDNPERVLPARCEELVARHGDRHLEWLRQAAHAGEPEAMLRYAAGEAFGVHGASFDYLRSPGFENWRREAPGMLQAVIEAGYPEAVIYRMIANQPDFGGPLANLLPADPVQDQAYNELFLLLNVDSPLVELMRTNLRSQAAEAVGAQARQQAARWHQDHFGGRTYDFEALNAEGRRGFPVMQAHGASCSVAIEGPTP
ncbi:MAG: hypothetical protein CL625_04995 [Arenimonas sp.]|nr:hypothetical protein [Arenimonas sp.]